MERFIDTNILYHKYANKKYSIDIKGQNIVSINALEFLKNIEKVHNNRAKYYIPSKSLSHLGAFDGFMRNHNRPFSGRVSDAAIFDFKQDFESYTFYNNETIAAVINDKAIPFFQLAISFLDKKLYKEIKSKFLFVVENELVCHPISKEDINLSYTLLDRFLEKHCLKDDFRNSWNDLLILGKVANSGGTLVSTDKLLNRFAASEFGAKILKNNKVFEYKFPKVESDKFYDMTEYESKGYINRGWSFRVNKGKQL